MLPFTHCHIGNATFRKHGLMTFQGNTPWGSSRADRERILANIGKSEAQAKGWRVLEQQILDYECQCKIVELIDQDDFHISISHFMSKRPPSCGINLCDFNSRVCKTRLLKLNLHMPFSKLYQFEFFGGNIFQL